MSTQKLLQRVLSLPPEQLDQLILRYTDILTSFETCELHCVYIHHLDSNEILISKDLQLPCKHLTILSNNSNVFTLDKIAITQLPGDDLVNALYQNLHYAINPLFTQSTINIQSKTVPMTKKKLAEVELALVQLQNNVEIPTIQLQIHPKVVEITNNDTGIPPEYLEDGHFLNELQTCVNDWLKSIKLLLSLQRDPRSGSAAQETSFWLDLEKTLEYVESQLKSSGCTTTLLILQQARRFHGSSSFIQDTGLKETLRVAKSYNFLFQEFPINDLLSSTTIPQITTSIIALFDHLNKKSKIAPYPVYKLLHLLEATSKDVNDVLLKTNIHSILSMSSNAFDQLVVEVQTLFQTWDDKFKEFGTVCRELLRKRAESFVPYKINNNHDKLHQRILFLIEFRQQHDSLLRSIVDIPIHQQHVVELNEAYSLLSNVLESNEEDLNSQCQFYMTKSMAIEHELMQVLRTLFKQADHPLQMIAIFSKYHHLLNRSTIRGHLLEFQSMSLNYIKQQITSVQDQYSNQYTNSALLKVHQSKGIPPISGKIIWIQSIEKQMQVWINKLQLIVGKQGTFEGNSLIQQSITFKSSLHYTHVLEEWHNSLQLTSVFDNTLFLLVRDIGGDSSHSERTHGGIKVNFRMHHLNVYRECRNLLFMDIQCPLPLQQFSKEIKKVYPLVLGLMNHFQSLIRKLSTMAHPLYIMMNPVSLYTLLQQSIHHNWHSHSFIQKIIECCLMMNTNHSTISHITNELSNTPINDTATIQSLFDQFTLNSIPYSHYYISDYMTTIYYPYYSHQLHQLLQLQLIQPLQHKQSTFSQLTTNSHQQSCLISIVNDVVHCEPSLYDCKELFCDLLNTHLQIPNIDVDRLTNSTSTRTSTYLDYLSNTTLLSSYSTVHSYFNQAHLHLQSLQSIAQLTTIDPTTFKQFTLDQLIECLQELKKILNQRSNYQSYGSILLDKTEFNHQVHQHCQSLLTSVVNQVTLKCFNQSTQLLNQIESYKQLLEQPIDQSTLLNQYLCHSKLINTNYSELTTPLASITKANHCLKSFPNQWIDVQRLQSQLQSLQSLTSTLVFNMNDLHSYYTNVVQNIHDAIHEYKMNKPTTLEQCEEYTTTFNTFTDTIRLFNQCPLPPIQVHLPLVELQDYYTVFTLANSHNDQLTSIGHSLITTIEPTVYYTQLQSLYTELNSLGLFYKQFDCINALLVKYEQYLACTFILHDLKAPWMDYHVLRIEVGNMLLIKDVWLVNKQLYKQTTTKLQGQYDCKQYLTSVETALSQFKLPWFAFTSSTSTKVMLIQSTTELTTVLIDATNGLQQLQASPYYTTIEIEAQSLLNCCISLYDWLEVISKVQQLYMDCYNVYKQQFAVLQQSQSLFNQCHTDFTSILTSVQKQPLYSHPTSPLLQQLPLLQSLVDKLTKCHSILINWLEEQRHLFPRFYFIGNDDLIQLLGDPFSINQHVSKLYPGIQEVVLASDKVAGITSHQGELVTIPNITITNTIETLTTVNNELKKVLHDSFVQCLELDIVKNCSTSVLQQYLEYPCQSSTLAIKCLLSRSVNATNSTTLLSLITKYKPSDRVQQLSCQQYLKVILSHSTEFKVDYTDKIMITLDYFQFEYQYEYYGIYNSIISTELTQLFYSTASMALKLYLGTSPSGPAGTGKTESVKQLAYELGQPCLVFCCDESFNTQVMTRLIKGCCAIGAFGCFDEFNRLDPLDMTILSHSIVTIQHQLSLLNHKQIGAKLVNIDSHSPNTSNITKSNEWLLHPLVGLFITMNPTYTGRHELPLYLKNCFRPLQMQSPESIIIVKSLLYCQLFTTSDVISKYLVDLMDHLQSNCSSMPFYDFGLRQLKQIVDQAGLLRMRSMDAMDAMDAMDNMDTTSMLVDSKELDYIKQALATTVYPKLTLQDQSHLQLTINRPSYTTIKPLHPNCHSLLTLLPQVQGIICVGYKGKSTTIQYCSNQLQYKVIEINAKCIPKHLLYGHLNPTSKEWTDGYFTSLIRQSTTNTQPLVIHFNGPLDPIWVENLNSVLDDNKQLTLPNGERLPLLKHVCIVFECIDLNHATLATISRNNIIYFDPNSVDTRLLLTRMCKTLNSSTSNDSSTSNSTNSITIDQLKLVFKLSLNLQHCMAYDIYMFIKRAESLVCPLPYRLFYSGSLDCTWEQRHLFLDLLTQEQLISSLFPASLLDTTLDTTALPVLQTRIDPNDDLKFNKMIPTVDTLRHDSIMTVLLNSNTSFLLCGPAGSGKTMSLCQLTSQLGYTVVLLNFSSDTTITQFLKSLHQHCTLVTTPTQTTLTNTSNTSKLVVICDEFNLTSPDAFNCVVLHELLYQMISANSYYDILLNKVVHLRNIVIIGACNPPSYSGRHVINNRLLHHVPVLYIGYPSTTALHSIYKPLLQSILVVLSSDQVSLISQALINCYLQCQSAFTMHSHYIYSPRELTRWLKGLTLYSECKSNDISSILSVIMYEGCRLFKDRLVSIKEQEECHAILLGVLSSLISMDSNMDTTSDATNTLTSIDRTHYYSPFQSTTPQLDTLSSIQTYLHHRMSLYNKETNYTPLQLVQPMIVLSLQVYRTLTQSNGHCVLFGSEGQGRTSLLYFIGWLTNAIVIECQVTLDYTVDQFDLLLKSLLTTIIKHKQHLYFIVNESSLINSGFIERMNTLLANSDGQGFFSIEELQHFNINLEQLNQLIAKYFHTLFILSFNSDNTINSQSPALFNRCVVIYCQEWTRKDYMAFASNSIESLESMDNTMTNSTLEAIADIHLHYKVSPCHFNHFCLLVNQFYTTTLAKQQQHHITLEQGIHCIEQTNQQLSVLKQELQSQQQNLQQQQEKSQSTLHVMVKQQQVTESKKLESSQLHEQLVSNEQEIKQRQLIVNTELAKVEPILLEAKQSVTMIKKQQLTEIKSMNKPPLMIQLMMECISLFMGVQPVDWKTVQSVVRRDDFITSILNYDPSHLSPTLVNSLTSYINKPEFTLESVDRASKACGPLYRWMMAQLEYYTIYSKVKPLLQETTELQQQLNKQQSDLQETTKIGRAHV